MKGVASIIPLIAFAACGQNAPEMSDNIPDTQVQWVDLSKREKPAPISAQPWQSVTVIVSDLESVAPLFTEIGGFETVTKSDNQWILRAPGSDSGYIHFVKNEQAKGPIRPATSRAWDKGCYWSIMMRAKDIPSIIIDAKPLGWTPLTDMAFLEFGSSKLNIIVLTHESGVRVQLYERLTTPLPDGFTPFKRISRPFNIMQMSEDRDKSYNFFQQGLGFDTFFYGPPYKSEEEEVMPLGLPPNLTTTKAYNTAIMTPFEGAEWGRVEMIDIEDMPGDDYSERCTEDYTGIYGISIPVTDIKATKTQLKLRNIKIHNDSGSSIWIKSPDGSNIEFMQQ